MMVTKLKEVTLINTKTAYYIFLHITYMKSLLPIVYNEDSKYVVGIQLVFQNAENVRFV